MICMMIVGILYMKSVTPQTSALGTSGLYQKEHIHQLSVEIVDLLSNHDYEGVYQRASLKMQKAMNKTTLQKAYVNLVDIKK